MEDWLDVRRSQNSFVAWVQTYTWTFDGRFRKAYGRITITDLPSLEDPFKIVDLPVYPIRFASEDVNEALRQRGHMFWKCRIKNYVSLDTELEDEKQNAVRYYL